MVDSDRQSLHREFVKVERLFFTLDDDAMAAVTGAVDLLELERPT